MPIIQKIRDKAAVLLFAVIVLSLIAFIMQDAFVGKTSQFFQPDVDKIGKVNNESLSKQQFDLLLDNYTKNYQNQGIDIGEDLKYNLIQNVWEGMIMSASLNEEITKLGLTIPQNEFQSMFFGTDISPYIKQQFTDPKTGVFDEQNVRQYLQKMKSLKEDNPDKKKFVDYFVKPIIESQLSNKFYAMLTSAVYVPKWMKEKLESQEAQQSKIQFINIPYTSISDSAVKSDNKEYLEYLNKNYSNLKNKVATKTINVIQLPIKPNQGDTLETFSKINILKQKFIASTNDKRFLLSNNNSNSNRLSNIFSKLSDYAEADKNIISKLKLKEVEGPYLNDGVCSIYKLIDKKNIPDSVQCRHILIAINENRDEKTAKNLIDSMLVFLKKGKPFAELVTQYSDDEGSKKTGGFYAFAYNQYDQLVPEFSQAIFLGKAGDKKIVKTSFGYHYIEVVSQKKSIEAYKVGIVSKSIDASKNTIDSVYQKMSEFVSQVNTPTEFFKLAINKGFLVSTITANENEFTSSIGFCRPIIKWAFDDKVNKGVSGVISIKDNLYVAIITGEIKKDEFNLNTIPSNIHTEYLNKKKADLIIAKNANKNLTALAESNSQIVQIATDIKFNQQNILNLSNEGNFIASTFNKNNTKKLLTYSGNNGVFYFIIDDIYAKTAGENITNIVNIDKQIENQVKNNIYAELADYFKSQNSVKDFRNIFF